MVFITSLANDWILGPSHLLIQGCFLAAMTGVGAGVATRASIRMLRINGPYGDEGKIAWVLHLPEGIIDFMIILINLAVAAAAFNVLGIFSLSYFTETAPNVLNDVLTEVQIWIQSLSKN
jgi:hypothetical protein